MERARVADAVRLPPGAGRSVGSLWEADIRWSMRSDVNLANAGFWALTTGWTGPLLLARWGIAIAVVVVPFLLLSHRLNAGRGPRTYRYAAS